MKEEGWVKESEQEASRQGEERAGAGIDTAKPAQPRSQERREVEIRMPTRASRA